MKSVLAYFHSKPIQWVFTHVDHVPVEGHVVQAADVVRTKVLRGGFGVAETA